MKLIQRRAYGFRNFENHRLRVIRFSIDHMLHWKQKHLIKNLIKLLEVWFLLAAINGKGTAKDYFNFQLLFDI